MSFSMTSQIKQPEAIQTKSRFSSDAYLVYRQTIYSLCLIDIDIGCDWVYVNTRLVAVSVSNACQLAAGVLGGGRCCCARECKPGKSAPGDLYRWGYDAVLLEMPTRRSALSCGAQ
jgi:hypothetical protein